MNLNQSRGKADHYFVIGINEQQSIVRCVLCKGSHYPPTTPRPVIVEISLVPPLCERQSEKSGNELKLWKLGSNPSEENEAVLALFAVHLNVIFMCKIYITVYIYSFYLISLLVEVIWNIEQ